MKGSFYGQLLKSQKTHRTFKKLRSEFGPQLLRSKRKQQRQSYKTIPSQTLTAFYKYYFELLSFKSMKIQETHKFDWFFGTDLTTRDDK